MDKLDFILKLRYTKNLGFEKSALNFLIFIYY
jgi:hypothetical protein